MPAKGTELGVGYISVVPSAQGFERKLQAQIGGDRIGQQIGAQINDGISSSLGRSGGAFTKFERNAEDSGEKAGDAMGRSMARNAERHIGRIDGRLKGGLDSVLGGLRNVAVAGGAMGGALVFAGKSAFDAFSDLSEATSKAQIVFGNSFGVIDETAKGAAKSMGLSERAALDAAATMGNLFSAFGIGQERSAEMSKSLLQLSGDLGSFNNVDPTEVLEALRAGLVGETEPLRRFGVNINEARIKAEALRLGLVKTNIDMAQVTAKTVALEQAQAAETKALKDFGAGSIQHRAATAAVATAQAALDKTLAGTNVELDAATKAQATYSLIMADTTLAQGDYARTAEGAANKQRTLSAEWDNFKARIGEKLAPLGTAVLGGLETALTWLNDWWVNNGEKVLEGLGRVKQWFFDTFGPDPVANFRAGMDILIGKFHEIFGEDPVANFQRGIQIIKDEWNLLFSEFERGAILINEKIGPAWDTLGKILLWLKDEVLDPLWGSLQRLPEVFGNVVEQIERLLDWIGKLGEPLGWLQDALSKLRGEGIDIPFVNQGGEGFAKGGVVGGAIGAPRLVLAHGGETILPTHTASLAALRGLNARELTPAATPGPLVGTLTVTGQADPSATAFMLRRELRRIAFYNGTAYGT